MVTRREERKQGGICALCEGPKDRLDRTLCKGCRDYTAEKNKERRERLKAQGICVTCGTRKVRKEHTDCAICAITKGGLKKRKYDDRRARGVCTRCEKPCEGARCKSCLEDARIATRNHMRRKRAIWTGIDGMSSA